MAEWWQSRRLTIAWGSLAVGLAAALKWHFSVAAASELEWMLRPLSLLLRLLMGWHFRPNADGEWQSVDAGIVLVKACAGINFMILSFLGACWAARPGHVVIGAGPRGMLPLRWKLLEWPALLAAALALAWFAALLVNALRIIAIVHLQPTLECWLAAGQAHRLLGLAVYLPALTLQLALTDRGQWRRAVRIGCGLYASLMLGVPLLTGHAQANLAAYVTHGAMVLAVLLPLLWLSRHPRRILPPSSQEAP